MLLSDTVVSTPSPPAIIIVSPNVTISVLPLSAPNKIFGLVTENSVPVNVKASPAVYVPAPEN